MPAKCSDPRYRLQFCERNTFWQQVYPLIVSKSTQGAMWGLNYIIFSNSSKTPLIHKRVHTTAYRKLARRWFPWCSTTGRLGTWWPECADRRRMRTKSSAGAQTLKQWWECVSWHILCPTGSRTWNTPQENTDNTNASMCLPIVRGHSEAKCLK